MATIGETILKLLDDAQSEVILVAPFMKAAVVAKIVNAIAVNVQIVCITRWRPHEIKAGVNDLEIWDVLQARKNAKLLLISTLHAKYYRSDDRYAIGSANLTKMALGWAPNPNVELLITGQLNTCLRKWESCLFSQAVEVDSALVKYYSRLVEKLPTPEFVLTEHRFDAEMSELLDSEASSPEIHSWLPMLRHPELLHDVYSGNMEMMGRSSKEAAMHDLVALSVPRGLDKNMFQAEVATALLQMPLVRRVDQYLSQSRRFGAVRDFLESSKGYHEGYNATTDWQTLMRWLLYFLPTRYRITVPNYSEVVQRID